MKSLHARLFVFLFVLSSLTVTAKPRLNTYSSLVTIYQELSLDEAGLSHSVFDYAIRGVQKVNPAKAILAIVDLSQPSVNKRLYVIDLLKRKLLFRTYVAHGRNSGDLYAQKFSNEVSSLQSSLGFYQTLGTYQGKHGLSLKLKGLENGFNTNALDRAVVMHGADYVSEDFIRKIGRLGRSFGCPAVPYGVHKDIIETLKNGACLFVFSPNQNYLKKSTFLL
ncbi:murein L,D-transpeptidase catalytic domain family protein [Runella sp. SP2]|uniref:murein L,D-transpeptidase catalytic domain family protein n=1 Tax=Runella sp. SP2 TaxID=2268026 RepID=UPI001E49F01C|nr:murein L,D-transpeptidase catalytic domain family protein [Runella sp. SP2]